MALNIFEELDLTSSGDNVDEGFLKCKNNWSDMDTELHNARDGEASLLAKIDTLAPTIGHFHRSQFTYVDGDTITVGGGSYDVNGTLALIEEELTTTAHGVTGADWAYLYIDYSSLPADNVLVQSDLIWSTTEPTWSHTKLGWYNGSDRCIFACRIAVTTDDISGFSHVGDLVQYTDFVVDVNASQLTTSFAAKALTIPDFGAMQAQVMFYSVYIDAESWLEYAPAATSPASSGNVVSHAVTADVDVIPNIMAVITDSSQQIKLRESDASTNTYNAYTVGWYFPKGL